MRFRTRTACCLPMLLLLGFVGTARADMTLGSTTAPAGSTATPCGFGPAAIVGQATSDPTTPYTVPAGGGAITAWQINTTGATAGTPVTLVVLRPSGGNYDVVGADAKTLPNPLPVGNIASFTPATPIGVTGGETLGLYTSGSNVTCFFNGGSTPSADTLFALNEPSAPAPGQTLSPLGPNSPAGYTMNVAATLHTAQDVAVATAATPASATVGNLAVLASTVTNAGPNAGPITFTDAVPAGLTVNAAAAGSGSCTTAGQTVTCTISGLSTGQSAPVNIIVTPTAAKSYANTVSVAASATDPNPANNSASATLAVAAAPATPKCIVPNLKRTPLSVAKRVVKLLGCKVGRTRKAHSSSVAKGLVINTSPKAGTYAAGRTVSLTESSGPKKKKHHRK